MTELQNYVATNPLGVLHESIPSAESLAHSLFLAHSTSDANFQEICSTNERLLSPEALDAAGVCPLRPDSVEVALGTQNFVFFYAAPFSYPSSGCGLFFATSLESDHSEDGFATSFDSGGLINHIQRIDMSESPRDFFRRHELGLPDHRSYLEQCLKGLFSSPLDYAHGNRPFYPGTIGLSGGDWRMWTHEIRIPNAVPIRNRHLQAVFLPLRLSLIPEITNFIRWCDSEGFDVIAFQADRDNDFTNLRRECLTYIFEQLST